MKAVACSFYTQSCFDKYKKLGLLICRNVASNNLTILLKKKLRTLLKKPPTNLLSYPISQPEIEIKETLSDECGLKIKGHNKR